MYYAFKLITTLFLLISLTVTGCQTEATPAAITPPTDVTNLNALNKDSSVLLTWIDSTDEDVYGYEVTWNKNSAINRSMSPMELNSMMVAPNACG